ncbi:MAG TPA: GNAT family N-acetyltransferase [Nocardioides sp.]|uniref:GNAT family N-acetyltransferase n=1 Tax=Nocardioides sp. TaxID=35761 RepID=UPI002E31B4F0|nr:GNAT family N-acetyltransferase [Nocardioides sp.]HEX5087429.1 GNAT family N-acetyltransferase [Nocardioides sp.]
MELPEGLSTRPLTRDDASAVYEVMAAQEAADLDEVMIEEADIVSDWSRASFDVEGSTIGVFDGDRLVAYGEVGTAGRCDAAVDPAYRGRGIGTAVAHWMQDNARSRGIAEIGMPVPQGSPGDRLLEALGYRVRWESWGLALPDGTMVPVRDVPEGYVVREADPSEYEQVWAVQEDAFLEWSDRDRETFEDWHASVTGRPGFEPWHLRVVVDPAGAVVAMAWVQFGMETAFISRLATKKEERGRGLAQALLVDSFAAGRARGARKSELSTDSRTGALSLYEKVGMVVTSTWVNRGLVL